MENIWTASTETKWISFCEVGDVSWEEWLQNRCTEITGEAGDRITIYVFEATSPYDEETGSIKIVTDDKVIEKEITRCVPKIDSSEVSINYTINGKDCDNCVTVEPCEGGISNNDNTGVNIENIVLTTVYILDNGSRMEPVTENLTLNDVNVTFIYNNGETSLVLKKNDGADRFVTVRVEYKQDISIYKDKIIKQLGLRKSDGTYKDDVITIIKEGEKKETYSNFDFGDECKVTNPIYCDAGTMAFSHKGTLKISYSKSTGKTICNDEVEIDNGNTETVMIPDNMVSYSVDNNEFFYFTDGNILNWVANTGTTNLKATVKAILTKTDGSTEEVTREISVPTGDCGKCAYIIFTSDSSSIPYTGGDITFTYYLSYSSIADETEAIKDSNLYDCLRGSFLNTSGDKSKFSIGNESEKSTGIFTTVVSFVESNKKCGVDGDIFKFSVSCDGDKICTPKTKEITLPQDRRSEYTSIDPNGNITCEGGTFKFTPKK